MEAFSGAETDFKLEIGDFPEKEIFFVHWGVARWVFWIHWRTPPRRFLNIWSTRFPTVCQHGKQCLLTIPRGKTPETERQISLDAS